ncbi:MAG TPA: NAD(P)(+) transhydrogenase (Re/Si-specific) subunit alpha, partial [Mycobacteriales bacterium]|nr:NAD(P)(+) transhydrogenase (Re/Si-specific) subunit alpha [Mycobacteriales bacterium]
MRVAVPRELVSGERRVAVVPDTIARLVARGAEVSVETGAGARAFITDDDLTARGAHVVADRHAMIEAADAVVSVQPLAAAEVASLHPGLVTISFLQPWAHADVIDVYARASVTSFSLDLVPRISRAQSMDALSSQALVAGYHAVVLAAEATPRMFPLFMTAAGTVAPAKVLVLGAGVAGLQAIATSR